MVGAVCLHEVWIHERRKGEGRRLVEILDFDLKAVDVGGVYLVMVNDYVA